MEKEFPDYIGSYAESERLVYLIRKYWETRGYYPEVWIEEKEQHSGDRRKNGRAVYLVRSDMVNGMPQRRVH